MNFYEHHLGDYLRDTAHLSMTEDGAYRRLIDAYYIRLGPLPLVRKDLYRLVRAAQKNERTAVDTVLAEFFTETPDGWCHKRCDAEIERYNLKKNKATEAANARWHGCERNANASPEHIDNVCVSNADALQTHPPSNAFPVSSPQSPIRGAKDAPVLHDSLPRETWDDWIAYRREKRLSLSHRALSRHLNLLADYDTSTQREMLETAMRAEWKGVFPPKGKPPKSKSSGPATSLEGIKWE